MIVFLFIFFVSSLTISAGEVLVSIAPYQGLVESIVGPEHTVRLLVPGGVSSHSFEASPKQLDRLQNADLWFCIGEQFEQRVMEVVDLKAVDLRQGVLLLHGHGCQHHRHDAADLHVWLSPEVLLIQIETILKAVTQQWPEQEEVFKTNSSMLKKSLRSLNSELKKRFEPYRGRAILVSHPAYGYLCRDIGIEQISVEVEGRDPTPKQLTELIQSVQLHQIRVVFTQPQHGNKGAEIIARQMGLSIKELDPYHHDVIGNLREITEAFLTSFKDE